MYKQLLLMKKKILLTMLAAAVLASCSRTELPAVGGGECTLTARLDVPPTRVESQTLANEKNIRNVQVFVFRAGPGGDAGVLEIAASAGFDRPLDRAEGFFNDITVKCSSGLREVWAVVNDARDRTSGADAVRTKREFLAIVHDLESSAPAQLLMIGRSNPDGPDPAVLLPEGPVEVFVPVHRLAAAVVLESVKNDFSSPAYQRAGSFRLDAAYLINVPGRIDFGESLTAGTLDGQYWYAQLAAERSGPRASLLYDDLGGAPLEYGSVYERRHTFYAYPNDCGPSGDPLFSPRATMLVLEASVKYPEGWTRFYYPVLLEGGLLSNKRYHVNLTVHRPGSRDPNEPVSFLDLTPVVTVSDWDDGETYNAEI